MICDPKDRLGSETNGGPQKLKAHPFFKGVNFNTLREQDGPFVPQLKSITDTSYFPTDELQDVQHDPLPKDKLQQGGGQLDMNTMMQKKDLAFVGYTFKKFDQLTRKNAL